MTGQKLAQYLRKAARGEDIWLRYEPWMEGLIGRDATLRTTSEIVKEAEKD